MPLPSPKELHFEMPLYEEINLGLYRTEDTFRLVFYVETVDAFCIDCGKDSVFQGIKNADWNFTGWNSIILTQVYSARLFSRQFYCTRDENHRVTNYFILQKGNKLMKIGQFPSVADFQIPQLEKYKRLLGEERHRELVRAAGLAAHGVGIGSFVYLRRVFESLIEDAHKQAGSMAGFDDTKYRGLRMEDKILMLKVFLPTFLVENRAIYAILSIGIHSLTEKECLRHYEPIKAGIELILDQRLEQEHRKAKEAEAQKVIAKIHGAMGQG